MHILNCNQNVKIRKIALAMWAEVEKNVNPSWQLETDRVGQRLTLGPSPSNWKFYAKMHIWGCLGLARNGLGVELDQRLDVRRALTIFLFEPCASTPISTQEVATGAGKVSAES